MSWLNFLFLFYYFCNIAFCKENQKEETVFLFAYITQWEPYSRLGLYGVNTHLLVTS